MVDASDFDASDFDAFIRPPGRLEEKPIPQNHHDLVQQALEKLKEAEALMLKAKEQ